MIIDRWQEWLALEHEAVWLFSTIGGRYPTLKKSARDAESQHRDTREKLQTRIRALGGEPVGTLAGYALDTSSESRSRRVAQDLEVRIAGVCLASVGESERKDRQFALDGLSTAALAELDWLGKPSAFPGTQPSR